MSRPPAYHIIYNWDGAPHGYSEVPQSMDAFLEKVYAPLEGTQVGAHFWCVGEHSARWPSEALELLGDVHGRRYENAENYVLTENIRRMLERGEDPQQALIARGRELGLHVYASLRMNDNHFNGAQLPDMATLHHTELTRLRREHPQWLLGEQTSEWFALSWNMAVPEVREHRFAHFREVCERYDWDGVELDWQRHAFHLPQEDAFRLRYVLTDLQRAARRLTDDLARQRGRPFYVAARVAGTPEMCRRIGYDLPAWIDERLVDLLIPAGGAGTDPSIDVAAFVELCRGTDIAVYPGFDGGLPDPFVGPEDAATKDRMRTRAIAARYHREGADGIYVFNWHANRDSRRELLSHVGSPETLRGTDKIYAATHRFLQKEGAWRGAYDNDRIWGEVPVALKRTLTGTGPTIVLDVTEGRWGVGAERHSGSQDRPPSPTEPSTPDTPTPQQLNTPTPQHPNTSTPHLLLRVRLDQWVRGDVVRVSWDGTVLQDAEVRYCTVGDPHRISDVSGAAWLCFPLKPEQVADGPHTVQVALEERHPQLASDLVLTDVELVIRYE